MAGREQARNFVLGAALLAASVAGCLGGDNDGRSNRNGNGPPPSDEVRAPWWPVGAWWDLEIDVKDRAPQTVRAVNFWNDSATTHFWLGVSDRRVALDHALHDTNPFLGRVHWLILTPHESGIHAQGMYSFPTEPGERFGGIAFDRTWEVTTTAGDRPGQLLFEGEATDGATMSYDYDPNLMWFSSLEIRDEAGTPDFRADVKGHGMGEAGTFYFHRGVDYYLGPEGTGTHDETFEVASETPALATLAIEFKGRSTGVLRIELQGPGGTTEYQGTLTGGQQLNKVVEVQAPQAGTWTMKFIGTGDFRGTIEAVGIIEYKKTI